MNCLLYEKIERLLNNNQDFQLFETVLCDEINKNSYLFYDSLENISTNEISKVSDCLKQASKLIEHGFTIAGFINFEAGYHFFRKLDYKNQSKINLLNLNAYKTVEKFDLDTVNKITICNEYQHKISSIKLNINKEDYMNNVKSILKNISKGNYYQANYSFPMEFKFEGSYLDFYCKLKEEQKTPYTVFIKSNNKIIISISPELFFRTEKGNISMEPMKGTSTNTLVSNLENDKNKSENYMIVDLIRNDLGQICKLGSIHVNNLLKKETYKTITQMTSKVEGQLKDNIDFKDLIVNLFPSGSITGTPKLASLKAIRKFENRDRGIYTGSIGFITPDLHSVWNVAIRTIEFENNIGILGIGSGIVYDSSPEEEFDECLLKAKFFLRTIDIYLFESVLYKNNKFYLLNRHKSRMMSSADYWGIEWIENNFIKTIDNIQSIIKDTSPYKIKICLLKNTKFSYTIEELKPYNKEGKIKISPDVVDSKEIFLKHKTSKRVLYNKYFLKAKEDSLVDYIFLNEKNVITESTICNIFCKIDSIYYTPPTESGLLKGTYRDFLLEKFPNKFKMKNISKEELLNSETIFLCNSVRGIIRVKLDE